MRRGASSGRAARGRRGPERGRATGAWRGRAAGGAPGLRGLRAGRQPAAAALAGHCRERAAAALESCEALRLHGEAVADGVRRVATDDRAADARRAARELGDAAAHEAAVFGALAGDASIVERASATAPPGRTGPGPRGVQRGAHADAADATAPAALDDAPTDPSLDRSPRAACPPSCAWRDPRRRRRRRRWPRPARGPSPRRSSR